MIDATHIKVLLTHPGTQYAPQLAAQLHRVGILNRFVTGIAFGDETDKAMWKLLKLLGKDKLAARRLVKGLPSEKLYCMPLQELKALIRMRRPYDSDDLFHRRNKRFQEKIPQHLLSKSDAVIGFDTSSWILAERSHKAGKPYIMDASIAHPLVKEEVFEKVRQRFPAWQAEIKPKHPRNIEVELREMEMADHIVAATQFTKNTYIHHGIPESKISVNPYGTDLSFFVPKEQEISYKFRASSFGHVAKDSQLKARGSQLITTDSQLPIPNTPLTFLFFGAITARKGFPWLCEIWKEFHAHNPHTRLVAAGFGNLPDGFELPKGVECIGAVHPQDRVQLFHSADVFVFPSFFEGFAQVIIEAMACGLPVITTTHTVGPEVIDNGVEGFVIAPGEDESLYHCLKYFSNHPEKIEAMGIAARERVLPLTWNAYGDRWQMIAERVVRGPLGPGGGLKSPDL